MGNQPEKKIRAGAVVATIWRNATTNNTGEQTHYYSVGLDRSYKDKNGEWKKTTSFRSSDLPKVVLVMNKAYEYLELEKGSQQAKATTTSTVSSNTDELEEIDIVM